MRSMTVGTGGNQALFLFLNADGHCDLFMELFMKSEVYGINAHDVYGLHKHIKYIGDEIVRRLDEMRKYTTYKHWLWYGETRDMVIVPPKEGFLNISIRNRCLSST